MTRSRWWSTSGPLAASLALTLAGPVPLAWSVTTGTSEVTPAQPSPPVSLKLQNAKLSQAIDLLTQQAQVVVANSKDLADKTVTVSLKDQPIEDALNLILTPNHIPWYRAENGTYMINSTRPSESPAVKDGHAGGVLPEVMALPPAPDLTTPRRYVVTEKIKLDHISPDDLLTQLGLPRNGLDRRNKTNFDSPRFNSYTGETASAMKITDGSSNRVLSPVNPTTSAGDLNNSGNGDEDTVLPEDGDSSASGAYRRSPEDRDEFGQVPILGGRRPGFQPRPNLPGFPNGQNQNPAGVPPGGANGGTNGTRGSTFVPPGIDLVAGLMNDNSLMVQGDPDAIEELQRIVRMLDVVPAQVSIKVDIITVTNTTLKQFGGSWQFFTREGNIRAQFGSVPEGLTLDVIRGNVEAVIGALTTNGRGRVIASPLVTTQNNVVANIAQGINTPVFIPVITTTNGGIVSQSLPQFVTSSTSLFVIPTINRDGTITVQGTISVQNVTRLVASPDGTNVAPETNFTSLSGFIRRVASGETLVLGGLNSKLENDEETRIPLLGDIPIIGRLFRSQRHNTQDTQLILFLTPTVVSDHANQGEAPP